MLFCGVSYTSPLGSLSRLEVLLIPFFQIYLKYMCIMTSKFNTNY